MTDEVEDLGESAEFVELQRCANEASVRDVLEVLDTAGIHHKLGTVASSLDPGIFGHSNSDGQSIVSVRFDDYKQAREALEAESLKVKLPDDHYLIDSTNEELLETVGKASEWSAFDVAHAKRILLERGISPDGAEKVEESRNELFKKLQKGKAASKWLIFAGVVLSFFGTIPGLLIGWSLASSKEKTPEGVFFTYDEKSRRAGNSIFILALIWTVVWSIALIVIGSH